MLIAYREISLIDDSELKEAFFMMSDERKKKCLRYRFDDDKRRCIAADMLARSFISEQTGIQAGEIRFSCRAGGKPFAENADMFFSVSHSGNYVAAAFSETDEVGADVECIRPVPASVMRFFCSEEDVSFILGGKALEDCCDKTGKKLTDKDVLERFFRVWCFKEAYFKCSGEGIGRSSALINYAGFTKKEIFLPDAVISAVE